MIIREFTASDIEQMMLIWNKVVEDGIAFPQDEPLTPETAREFFSAQSFTGVCEENGEILGLYILHPNNVGRCGHISNASYAVRSDQRGKGIGKKLVTHCLKKAKRGKRIILWSTKWKLTAFMSNFVGRYLCARYTFKYNNRPYKHQ